MTQPEQISLTGRAYLVAATHLLQDIRLEHPYAGVWEAADLQWWWRKPRSTDSVRQAFWTDADGRSLGAAIRTDWNGTIGLDVIAHPLLDSDTVHDLWSTALDLVRSTPSVESMVDADDHLAIAHLTEAGFTDSGDRGISAWIDEPRSPDVGSLPHDYRLIDRASTNTEPHHMADRNGAGVEERLNETSLYRADLDLLVIDRTGAPASYGLFWFDPVTHVGFVEPMGTHEGHRSQGLAKYILGTGIHRLIRCGAKRIRINYEVGNEAATALYTGVGFEPTTTTAMYINPA